MDEQGGIRRWTDKHVRPSDRFVCTLNGWLACSSRRHGMHSSEVLGEQTNRRKSSAKTQAHSKPFSLIEHPALVSSGSTISWATRENGQPQRMSGHPSNEGERQNPTGERSTRHRDCEQLLTPTIQARQIRSTMLTQRRGNPIATPSLRTHSALKDRRAFSLLSSFTDASSWPSSVLATRQRTPYGTNGSRPFLG
jgi:hypothetical protein